MAVTKTKKGFPSVVVSPTYGAYAGVSKTATEIHLCKEEKKIIVDGVLYASEKSCMCGSDTASTGGWYKLGHLECNSDDYVNVNVICSIMETFNSAYSGLFVLQARHEKAGSWSIKKLQWLARIGFNATAVKCVIDGHKAYLYAYKTTTQHSRLFIKVLCESGWNNRTPYLFLADNSTPETSTPGGTTIAECCAPTATKLQTARNISLGGALWGAAIPFNGSSDISIQGALKHVVSSNDNQCNYPYRRFCSFGSKASPITGNYNDIHATFLIFRPDTPYICGLLRIYLRTNDANSVSTTSAQWSFCGNTTKPPIHCAIRNENGATYADYFIQHSSTYECYHIYLIAQSTARANANGNISNNIIKLYGPYEARNTTATDKLTSSEVYLTIEEAATILHAQAYSMVTTAGMGGYVIESYRSQYIRQAAASATAERRVLLGENHDTTQYDKVYKSSRLLFNPATGALTATTFIGSLNGNASSATTATKVSQVLRIKDAGSSGDGITYNGSSELGITVPTEMVGSMTGGGILLKVPSKAAIGLGNVDNTADANKSVKSATTATNLASAPVIAAGTTSTNAITVTAGGKKSAEFTVPYATKAGSATSAGALAANSYINTHPENNGTIIPFMNNDLAFLLRKGGSAVVKFDNTVVEKDISNVFDGTASYWAGNNLSSLGYSSMTIELTLHKAFAHGTTFYIDFGNVGWRAKTVKVEVINTNYADDVWTTKINRTNNGSGHVNGSVSHAPVGGSNGSGFNKIRITLSDWNTPTDCRIAEIGLLNYASGGLSETFLSKGGGKVYGNIIPFKNNTYDLGSDTNRWRNIYGTASNVTVASGSTDAYRAIVVHNGNTLYSAGTNTGKPRYNYATGDVMSKSFTTDGGNFNGNATSATTATKVSQVLRIKDAGSSGDGITYNGSSEFGITVPTEMVGSLTGGGLLLKVPSKAAIGLGNVDNTADANKSVKSATTATNLASAPVIAAGTTSTNAITVTAGGKKSAEFTVPYATKAGSATSATTATKVSNALTFDLAGQLPYDGSTPLTVVVPTDMIATASSGGFTFKRASKTFCAIVNTVVSATPFWKIKLTSYSDNFNGHAPQNGDTLFLWVKNTIASSSTAYPFCIPYGTAGESDNSKCIPLYHGQNSGTPKEWLGSTALSAGFYMFVFRSDVRGTSTAITTNGGWVFLYRNVSTT